MEAGQTVYVMGGGYYEVVSVGAGTAVLKNLYDEPANVAQGTPVNGSGTALAIVGGARGRGAYTYTTANFNQPAVGATTNVSVADTSVFIADTWVYVATGGVYYVTAIVDSTTFTLRNEGLPGSAAPAAVIASGSKLSPSGHPQTQITRSFTNVAATPTTATIADDVILVDATVGNITLNLPAVAVASGIQFDIKKTDVSANTVIVTANGAETIDGAVTATLTVQYENITIVCDGIEWHIL
jgi:hypothetical protein